MKHEKTTQQLLIYIVSLWTTKKFQRILTILCLDVTCSEHFGKKTSTHTACFKT